ncbi:hypothetical protein WI209_24820 (plasmid) [Salmonella enterica subsp. enterica serovar Infantis]
MGFMLGELVTTAAIMGRKLRDQDGHEKSPQAVTRMINFFVKEGMITTKGTRFGTVISITNYGQYQEISPDEPCDKPSDNNKPSNGAALKHSPDEPCDKPSDEQNKKVVNKKVVNNNKTPLPPNGGGAQCGITESALSASLTLYKLTIFIQLIPGIRHNTVLANLAGADMN